MQETPFEAQQCASLLSPLPNVLGVGYLCTSVVAGLLLFHVPRESRLSPWPAGCNAQLRVAAMDPSVTLLGVGGPSTVRSNSTFLLQFFC